MADAIDQTEIIRRIRSLGEPGPGPSIDLPTHLPRTFRQTVNEIFLFTLSIAILGVQLFATMPWRWLW